LDPFRIGFIGLYYPCSVFQASNRSAPKKGIYKQSQLT
jgi:hypothetical protein